ncbi:MAG: hypothetical protein EOM37_11910 [Proteobacteria bacterium]|jgi:hypothetical protein|nr:hypothetical protein [Pseudomonadota bacterium]
MNDNNFKRNFNGIKGDIIDQWQAMQYDDMSEFEEKLEKMSDLLQEDGDLKYDNEDYYTIFE